jgi:hypothetical protein
MNSPRLQICQLAGFADNGDLVVEGKVTFKKNVEVLGGAYRLDGCMWINLKRMAVEF